MPVVSFADVVQSVGRTKQTVPSSSPSRLGEHSDVRGAQGLLWFGYDEGISMEEPVWVQVSPFVSDCQQYVARKFRMESDSAEEIVQEVWASLIDKPAVQLPNPRRYLLRACRWRALQVLRDRKQEGELYAQIADQKKKDVAPEAPEILIALEDEDKPLFYKGRVTPCQEEVLDLMIEGHSEVEVSAILKIPASTVRMRVHLARKRLTA
jgi:DNA-directed RNA polymerase specialized sigma24 family protein